MKNREKRNRREIRVGAVIIVALTIIIAVVFALGGEEQMFGHKVRYKILFSSTAGLYEGDPVLLTGVEIGNVSRLAFPEDINQKSILVEIEVRQDVANRIRQDTRASIASASLVYGKVVTLSMGSPELDPIKPGEYIQTLKTGNISSIMMNTDSALASINSIVRRMERGDGLAGLILKGSPEVEATLRSLAISSNRLEKIISRVEKGEGAAGSLLADSTDIYLALTELKQVVGDLHQVSNNLVGSGSVAGRLLNDEAYGDSLTRDLQSTLRSLASITAKIDSGRGTIGSLINDPVLYYGLQDIVLGIENNKLAKWFLQNRRKAGEKARMKLEESNETR